jgi:hypothetical protein
MLPHKALFRKRLGINLVHNVIDVITMVSIVDGSPFIEVRFHHLGMRPSIVGVKATKEN